MPNYCYYEDNMPLPGFKYLINFNSKIFTTERSLRDLHI